MPPLNTPPPSLNDDIVIIGTGLAGLYCALMLAPRPVTLLTASTLTAGGSSHWAQGGIAAALRPGDTPAAHAQDTIAAGDGLVNAEAALALASEARTHIETLIAFGVPFSRDDNGTLTCGREAAHSAERIIHVEGDQAGAAIMQALIRAVQATPSIRVLEHVAAEALIKAEHGPDTGRIVAMQATHRPPFGQAARLVLHTRNIVLATGGLGQLYTTTTNPPGIYGAGLAMAAMAGACLRDCAFVQFHPTAFNTQIDPAPLATEALRGAGAVLVDHEGQRFMAGLHASGELAPRDHVARAVHRQVQTGKGASLDCRAAIGAAFPEAFPTVFAACRASGLDPRTTPIPVAPAAHYHMGGIKTDNAGRSSLPGLWAIGEVAATGVHGANRLASNSLLETLVYGARAAKALAASSDPARKFAIKHESMQAPIPTCPNDVRALRTLMSAHVGVERTGIGMGKALATLDEWASTPQSPAFALMVTAARLVTASALMRTESRGAHYRLDYPEKDPAQATPQDIYLRDLDALSLSGAHVPSSVSSHAPSFMEFS